MTKLQDYVDGKMTFKEYQEALDKMDEEELRAVVAEGIALMVTQNNRLTQNENGDN